MNATTANPIVGRLAPPSRPLTDYLEFKMPYWQGLAKVETREGKRVLDVLAIHMRYPGRGHFRTFVELAKKHYDVIEFWDTHGPVSPDWFESKLHDYGFRPCRKADYPIGEPEFNAGEASPHVKVLTVDGMVWVK
jgi:hypothetical protein